MKTTLQLRDLVLFSVFLGLAACGGGSDGGNGQSANSPPTTPAAPTPVAVVGTITGFGSIYVNGIRYAVRANTVVDIEGQPRALGDDSGLRLGMKVRVMSDDSNGQRVASHVEFDDDLRGPIESISIDATDPTTGSFVVLGQTVVVDGNTIFDDDVGNNDNTAGIDIRDLAVGMIVEVSGFPIDVGYLATRVDRERNNDGSDPDVGRPDRDDDELELKGFVDSIAADGSTITVSGIQFTVNANTLFDDGLSPGGDLVGVFVEIKADVDGSNYIAVRIEREDDFDFDNDDDSDERRGEFEIEGVLQSVDTSAAPNTFTIDGITVPVVDAAPLAGLVGMRVEIKGSFNADQVLVLREAEQDFQNNVETEDLVSFVDVSAGTFTTRLGLAIAPTGASRIEDDVSDDDRLTPDEFINRLQIGDRVEARGISADGGAVDWNRIERDESAGSNDDFECELQGPVQSIDGDAGSFSFVIQGVTVLTTSVNDNDFEGADDTPIGRAAFFERLAVGDTVEAESFEGDAYCMPGTLDAREVSFEDNDSSGSNDD